MKKYKLGDLLFEFHAGKAIQTENIKNKGAYPVYGGNGQRGYTDSYNQNGEYLIIGRQGAYCGNVRYNIGKAYLTEHAIVGQAKENHNPIYIALKLSLMNLSQLQGQSAQPGLSVNTLSCISMEMPPKEIQDKIADIMLKLDRKIELNRQINDNLEAMAKQLYDYWFVQFDFPNEEGKPYKSSGGALVYNEELKREIPQGWHCYELNKWLEIKSGFAFKSETYISKGKFKVVTIKNVQDHHLDTSSCDYVYEIPQGMKEWCSLSVNDRLISLTGNCGRLCIVTENDLLLNQRVGLLACNDEYIDYAYLLLSSEEYQTLSNNLAKGAAQANLSPVDLCKNIAVLPKLDVLEKFNRQIKPIVASYIQNEIQIAELTKQRDELLPLLMNGQASVNYHLSDD